MAGNPTSNDVLAKLTSSFQTLIDNSEPLEKIIKIINILNNKNENDPEDDHEDDKSFYLMDNVKYKIISTHNIYALENEYFNNVISEYSSKKDESRVDTRYTVISSLFEAPTYDDIYSTDNKHTLVGQGNVVTWGSRLITDKTKKIWTSLNSVMLDRNALGKVKSTEEKVDINQDKKYVILDVITSVNLFDYVKQTYDTINYDKIVNGNDNLFYRVKKLPLDSRDKNKIPYKLYLLNKM